MDTQAPIILTLTREEAIHLVARHAIGHSMMHMEDEDLVEGQTLNARLIHQYFVENERHVDVCNDLTDKMINLFRELEPEMTLIARAMNNADEQLKS